MKVNRVMLMIRLVNRITAERDYWKAKVEALHEGKPYVHFKIIPIWKSIRIISQ